MRDIAIHVDGIGKRYRLGTSRAPGTIMLREAIADLAGAPFRSLRAVGRRLHSAPGPAPAARRPDHVWALRNVSFTVPRGQILGIIGPNGAGKSTLLKILSRITEPTEGRVEIHGRVGSLLEVGTGFHPELTGFENIYLSGALLGMRKAEIDRNLDEIVAFAEIDKFMDTPVKHYSSGMYVRLAFAVAAHLEPEILIVDEVLAVGDVSFQRKCLNKMEDVRRHGRTILFVSHNMQAITRLCERAILISHGGVQHDASASETAGKYLLESTSTPCERAWSEPELGPGDDVVRLRRVRVRDEAGATIESIDIRRPFGVEFVYEVTGDSPRLDPSVIFHNESGMCVFLTQDLDPAWRGRRRPLGTYTNVAWIPGNLLSEGLLLISVSIGTPKPLRNHVFARDVVAVHAVDSFEPDSARGDWDGPLPGAIRPLLRWTTEVSGSSIPSEPTGANP
jgi:homopolymeric O-antigen transport system ATP-binding protein